jgi:glycosyltransferase involved in cell wall biosynthesis
MRKNRTILFYINSLVYGGAERVISQLANHFADNGYQSILLTSFVTENEYKLNNKVQRISIEQEQIIQSRLKRNISRIKAIRKICKEKKPSVIVSFMAEPNFRAVCATMGLKTKVIVSVRNDPAYEYGGIFKYVGKYILPLADGCVFQTRDEQRWFPQMLQRKSAIIFNEVNQQFFEEKWVGGDSIVTLGRLTQQKNQSLLIRAFSMIADEFPQITLEIYGEGNLKEELQNEIDNLKCRDRISLRGMTKEPVKVLKNSAMFVLPSNFEGMPNALLEAMSVGVPCISTDCPAGGSKMIIRDGENGLLTPVNDEKSLAYNMKKILEDKSYAKQLAENARIDAKAYHPDLIFKQWEEYILGVIK